MVNDINNWLQQLGLDQYASLFSDNGINLQALPHITEQDLVELGVLLGHRRIMLAAIARLEDDQPPARTSDAAPPSQTQAAAGEHRQVSIIFADLVGYTSLSAALDAEEVHKLLACFLDAVDDVIVEHGGTIDKHLGDCVMGLFGAPIAHSNDPARALYAAQEILQRMPVISERAGHALGVHIGVANGQVVASGVGKDTHYTVTGDSVNLASRLTDAAGAGEALLSDGVRNAVGDAFEFEDRGELELKGIARPVRVYRLLGTTPDHQKPTQQAFVGRQTEIQQFTGILRACQETSTGQVVYLRGEAGIGKTSLSKRFEQIAGEHGISSHRALVLDFGMGREQGVEQTLLRNLLQLSAESSGDERSSAVDEAIKAGIVSADDVIFLNELLGVPQSPELFSLYDAMDAETRDQGKVDTLMSVLKHLGQGSPQLLLVEDVHWADASLLRFLAALAAALVDQPCILVMTSRIDGDRLDQGWKQQAAAVPLVTFDLRPLRSEDALALAQEYSGASDDYVRQCVVRAAGNPLYLEQLLRNAGKQDSDEVPGSVQSIVQASLDALDPADREAVQAASVLGQQFNLTALRHVLENSGYRIEALQKNNLVKVEGAAYLFVHALVQEAIYQSLLRSRRSALHQRAATWYGDHEPELRARHLDRAGAPDAALAYQQAAQLKLEELHFEAALELAQRGLSLAQDDNERGQLLLSISRAYRYQGDAAQGIENTERALALATGDQLRCHAWLELAKNLRLTDEHPRAFSALESAEARAHSGGLSEDLGRINYLRGNLFFMTGNIPGCLVEHQQALALAEKSDSAEGMALALGGLGDADYLRGHMRSARDRFQACVELSREHGFGQIEVANRHMVGWSRIFLMEFDHALEDGLAAVKMAARVGHHRAEMIGAELAGLIYMERADFERAREYLERNHELATRLNAGNFVAQAQFMLARLALAEGQMKQAREHSEKALATVRTVGTAFIGPSTLAICAQLTEDRDQQDAWLDEGEKILADGCVSHNYFHYTRIAIDICLAQENWSDLERYCEILQVYTGEQPLEWSEFIVTRGRALAAWVQGNPSQQVRHNLARLREQARQVGLELERMPLDEALDRAW